MALILKKSLFGENSHFLLPFLALGLTSCIVTYRDFPSVQAQLQLPQSKNLSISYQLNFEELTWPPYLYVKSLNVQHALERSFEEERVFSDATPALTPPAKGLFVLVSAKLKPHSLLYDTLGAISGNFYLLLPVYSGKGGYIVRYELYIDKQLRKVYRYEITEKMVVWLGLLPFVWVNFFTYTEEEAFVATAHQFFHDAEADGFFQ